MSDRILTIKQPYVSSILSGEKSVENRSTNVSYRGRVWLHAGLSVARDAVLPVGASLKGEDWDLLPRGVILGSALLVDVVQDSDDPWAIEGYYHWVLAEPEPIVPFRFKGALGLRRFDPALAIAG